MDKNVFAVLMAGGVGSRFWPVSTAGNPKQFRDLLGTGETLIQTTYKRLKKMIPEENILILTNEKYNQLVREQLPGIKEEQIIGEPVMRNTAPAVLLAALKIRKKNPNAVMVMAPSDHWIENEAAFHEDIRQAVASCMEQEKIVTLGIKPTFPNTGYGYIRYEQDASKIKKVLNFTEKPSFEKAQSFLNEGNYVWNAGIFIWNINYLLRSFKRNLPEIFELFTKGDAVFNTPEETAFVKTYFPEAMDISIDYGILEKEDNVYMVLASFDWNDLGTWGSVYNEVEKDAQENAVLNARVLAEDATGNVISSFSNKVLVVDGLQDYIIIDEKDVLMLVPKSKEQEIKVIRQRVQQKFGEDLG